MVRFLVKPQASRSDARANRERLIAAAHAVVAERGPDAEMKEIAERAGVGVGTIYRNFATKGDLLAALVEDVQGRIETSFAGLLDLEEPLASLERLLEMIWEIGDSYGGLWQALQAGTLPAECIDAARDERIRSETTRLFEAGVAAGVFTEVIPPAHMALLTEGVAKCYVDLKEQGPPGEAQASCRAFILRALLAGPAAPPD